MTLRSCYVAYPIDSAQDTSFLALVARGEKELLANGVSVLFDPGDAFKVAPQTSVSGVVSDINAYAADRCNGMLAFLPTGVPTIGVPIEIERAWRTGKPVAVVSDTVSQMLPKDARVRQFPWSEDGVGAAAFWLAARETGVVAEAQIEPLPFVGGGELPIKGYADDAGFDLVVSQDTEIQAGQFADVPCDLAVELPEWSFGWITGRSSALRKRGLLVHTAIIDAGYRGPLYAGAWNMTSHHILVKKGERIAQMIILPNVGRDLTPVRAEALNPSERGNRGFGSTG